MHEERNKKSLWKTLQKEEGKYVPTKEFINNRISSQQDPIRISEQIDDEGQDHNNDFLSQMRKLVAEEVMNSSQGQHDQDVVEPENIVEPHHFSKGQFGSFNQLNRNDSSKGPYMIELNKKSGIISKFNEKFYQFKVIVSGMKIENQTLMMVIEDHKQLLMEFFKDQVNNLSQFLQNFLREKLQAMESKIKEQQQTIKKLKQVSGTRNGNQQMLQLKQQLIYLGQQYEKAQRILKEHQNTIAALETQNDSLQEVLFDYEQRKVQLDLEIESRIQGLMKDAQKDGDKQYYLRQINILEEEIEKLSQKCLRNNSERQFMLEREHMLQERESQMVNRESHLDEQFNQMEFRQTQIQKSLEKLKIKQAQLQHIENNLYKRMEELDLKENQLYAARRNQNKRILGSQVHANQDRRMVDEEDFQLHGKCFNKLQEKQYRGSQALQRPTSTLNATKKNDQFFSRVTRDFERSSNHGSKPKDTVMKSRVGSKVQRSPSNGSRINTLGSKLEQLRSEIKRQIDAIK